MIDEDTLERLRVQGDQPAPLFGDRVCANPACGRVLERRPRESRSNFRHRRTCDRACRRACSRTVEALNVRSCPVCGAVLVQRPEERPGNFRKRKTCGHGCAVELRAPGRLNLAATRKAEPSPPVLASVKPSRVKTAPARPGRGVMDPRDIREEWERVGQWGMTREGFARMLKVSRYQVDQALEGVA